MTVIITIAIGLGVLYLIGAIIDKLSEKHCPNDGQVMEYNSYGGFECPQCGRYEKNGNVLQAGKWLEPPYVIDKKDVWFEKGVVILGEGAGELQGMYLCKLRDGGQEYYRYLSGKQLK